MSDGTFRLRDKLPLCLAIDWKIVAFEKLDHCSRSSLKRRHCNHYANCLMGSKPTSSITIVDSSSRFYFVVKFFRKKKLGKNGYEHDEKKCSC